MRDPPAIVDRHPRAADGRAVRELDVPEEGLAGIVLEHRLAPAEVGEGGRVGGAVDAGGAGDRGRFVVRDAVSAVIGQRAEVRGLVDDLEMLEHPARLDRRVREGGGEARDAGTRTDVRPVVPDVRSVDHRVIERGEVVDDRRADLGDPRGQMVGRVVVAVGPEHAQIEERRGRAGRIDDPSGELRRSVENAGVGAAEREEPRVGHRIADRPARVRLDVVVDLRDPVEGQRGREEVGHREIHRIHRGDRARVDGEIPLGVGDHEVVVRARVDEQVMELIRVEPVGSEDLVEGGREVGQPRCALLGGEERGGEHADRLRFILGEEELSRGVDPVLEVVGDARVGSLGDRLESVIPPTDKGRTLRGRNVRVLLGEPIVPGAIVLVRSVEGGPRGPEVIVRRVGRIELEPGRQSGPNLGRVLGFGVARNARVDRDPHVGEHDDEDERHHEDVARLERLAEGGELASPVGEGRRGSSQLPVPGDVERPTYRLGR